MLSTSGNVAPLFWITVVATLRSSKAVRLIRTGADTRRYWHISVNFSDPRWKLVTGSLSIETVSAMIPA
jgi:hypothetical protein